MVYNHIIEREISKETYSNFITGGIKMKRYNQKGFTLIELIVVIAIIGVLAGILIPSLIGYIRKARRISDLSSARVIAEDLQMALATDDEIFNEFFCQVSGYGRAGKGSGINGDWAKRGVPYKFVFVARLDGTKSGLNKDEKNWTNVQTENTDFCTLYNAECGYKDGDKDVKIPLKLRLSKDGKTYNRWVLGYRPDTMQVEVWVCQAMGAGGMGNNCIRLYPDPMVSKYK